jgi:hypothetical protein
MYECLDAAFYVLDAKGLEALKKNKITDGSIEAAIRKHLSEIQTDPHSFVLNGQFVSALSLFEIYRNIRHLFSKNAKILIDKSYLELKESLITKQVEHEPFFRMIIASLNCRQMGIETIQKTRNIAKKKKFTLGSEMRNQFLLNCAQYGIDFSAIEKMINKLLDIGKGKYYVSEHESYTSDELEIVKKLKPTEAASTEAEPETETASAEAEPEDFVEEPMFDEQAPTDLEKIKEQEQPIDESTNSIKMDQPVENEENTTLDSPGEPVTTPPEVLNQEESESFTVPVYQSNAEMRRLAAQAKKIREDERKRLASLKTRETADKKISYVGLSHPKAALLSQYNEQTNICKNIGDITTEYKGLFCPEIVSARAMKFLCQLWDLQVDYFKFLKFHTLFGGLARKSPTGSGMVFYLNGKKHTFDIPHGSSVFYPSDAREFYAELGISPEYFYKVSEADIWEKFEDNL